MRKIILLLFSIIPFVASAYDFELKNAEGVTIYYNLLSKSECEVTFYEYKEYYSWPSYNWSYEGTIIIPSTIEYGSKTLTVASISENAFNYCWGLKSVEIPNSVKSIGKNAFHYCKNLSSVNLPENLTIIESGLFSQCEKVETINIPNGVTVIGDDAFFGCRLNTLLLPSNLTTIGVGAFSLNAFETLTIPNTVTLIDRAAFSGCFNLSSIKLPEHINSIGSRLFANCEKLTSVIIPSNVTSIGESAFEGCERLVSLMIPNSVKEIETNTFRNCSSLCAITIPESISSIGKWSFKGCTSLVSVNVLSTIPPTVDSEAFDYTEKYITKDLLVPVGCASIYSSADVWKDFWEIRESGSESQQKQCAKPIIEYKNGKLCFSSETENALFYSTISDNDIRSYSDSEINLSVTYNISVYAAADGYTNSETSTATLCWLESAPRMEGTDIQVLVSAPILIKTTPSVIIVDGATVDSIDFYNIFGNYLGSESVFNGHAEFSTEEKIVFVKIGDRSIKIKK